MENSIPLTPINFIQVQCNIFQLPLKKKTLFALNSKNYTKYLLPNLSKLTGEENFAEVAIGWDPVGLEIFASIDQPFQGTQYPQYERGDSLELCIDTRDVKTSGYNTRFCHHFFFLPELIEGRQCGEDTKFRTDDAHEPCDPQELHVQTIFGKKNYILQCHIPSESLIGYDPDQFDRIGMTYRINRVNGAPQQFSVLAQEYKFQEQPSLWSSLKLIQ